MAWYTPSQIAAAGPPELPGHTRGINRIASSEGWRADGERARNAAGRGGGWTYHESLLPDAVALRLRLMEAAQEPAPATAAWARFEALPQEAQDEAHRRLMVLQSWDALRSALSATDAADRLMTEYGCSQRTLRRWQAMVRGVRKSDRLPQLAGVLTKRDRTDCHPKLYAALKSDYLREEGPGFESCYRRVAELSRKEGWTPLPTSRTMRRHLDADVPRAVQILTRKTRDDAKALYPAQTRTRAHMRAMEAVNMDGHRFDVFIQTEAAILRCQLITLQDLYSGKFLAWRLAASENKDAVRLVIGDMITRHGIPEHIYLDNGRAFASKQITGGTKTRYRYKSNPEDPDGLLTTLGVQVHWTTPYSGQSKPIERAFRDLTDDIARHPACAGAYTGNRPDAKPDNYGTRAVPLETFRALVNAKIAEHNARTGRRAETAGGRSFDETFEASLAQPDTIVRWATKAQRALWLLAAERVSARRGNGEIHFMGNRYWSPEMVEHAGTKVTVRYDPDALQQPLAVYDARNSLICRADCIAKTGFDDTEAARRHSRDRAAYLKALRTQRRTHVEMTPAQLAALYDDAAVQDAAAPAAPDMPNIPRIVPAVRRPVEQDAAGLWDDEAEADFVAGLRMITGGR